MLPPTTLITCDIKKNWSLHLRMTAAPAAVYLVLFITISLPLLLTISSSLVQADSIQLANILPKLQAIHEDAKSLLIENVKLKSKILSGLQLQNEAKIKLVKELKISDSSVEQDVQVNKTTLTTSTFNPQYLTTQPADTTTTTKPSLANQLNKTPTLPSQTQQHKTNESSPIDFAELEEFNKWVETNLEYAVKNTQASAEALKEEAQLNNGKVDYSEQAIKDGIEGVKYWQSAVIFQDKTLKNEKYEPQE